MSLIKGRYVLGTSIAEDRWLDERTGVLYYDATGIKRAHCGFRKDPDGTWVRGHYVWRADPEPVADWYVWCFYPFASKYFTDGPYTEQGARSKAVDSAAEYPKNTYAVYQVLSGNTVRVVPPTPPQPEVIWS